MRSWELNYYSIQPRCNYLEWVLYNSCNHKTSRTCVCTSQRSASFSLSVGFVVCFTRGCCHFHPFGLFTALCYEIKQKNGTYSCTSSPSSPPPPPQASCQLLCVEIYIMRVEYRNLSVSTIKHNDVIRALKQKSYHIVLAPVVRSPE